VTYLVHRKLKGTVPEDPHMHKKVKNNKIIFFNENTKKAMLLILLLFCLLQGRGNVDSVFLQRIFKLIKIVIPSWKSPALLDIVLLTVFLVFRTYLSIWVASANGRIVKAIIKLDLKLFLQRVRDILMGAFSFLYAKKEEETTQKDNNRDELVWF